MSPISDYYVYYKVTAGCFDDYIPVVIAMQSDVYRLTGVRGRLKKKSADDATWMEIYEGIHQRLLFEATLADCVARFGVEQFQLEGSVRRSEIFHDPLWRDRRDLGSRHHMCLIGIAWKAHPDFPLIVAANRDEFHARATAPSVWWRDAPHLLAGRDLQSGGTWMGITRQGRFAALTNVRDSGGQLALAPTRGALVADFLCGDFPPASYAAGLAAHAGHYNGFNLLAGTPEQLWYGGNRGAASQALSPGIYGLSNALLDTPWPKVTSLKTALGAALGGMMAEGPLQSRVSGLLPALFSALFSALGSPHPAPDALLPDTGVPLERERALSAALIIAPVYGTRASTVLCVARDGAVVWEERSITPEGRVAHTVREQFQLA